jgi:hypothetical protein
MGRSSFVESVQIWEVEKEVRVLKSIKNLIFLSIRVGRRQLFACGFVSAEGKEAFMITIRERTLLVASRHVTIQMIG